VSAPYRYHAYGLDIRSDLHLPLPTERTAGRSPTVRIEARSPTSDEKEYLRLSLNNGAEARIPDDNTIIVDESAKATPLVQSFLLTNCLGILLYKRNHAVLHASAVCVGESAVAFLGYPGSGKSSLAVKMYERGHRVLTGDVLPINLQPEMPQAIPSFPRLSLSEDIRASFSSSIDSVGPSDSVTNERWYAIGDGFTHERVPLAAIYVLAKRGTVASAKLSSLRPQKAVKRLLQHSPHAEVLDATNTVDRHFRQCTSLAREVPIKLVKRPNDLTAVDDVVDTVVRDLHVK